MRIGVLFLPEFGWTEAKELWRGAEDLGFDHAWTYDHLAWRSLRNSPWYGAVPVLAAAAVVTERIRLGTLVASPNFRHPMTLARELITLDDLSRGRFTLGIGAGGLGWDAVMLGNEPWPPAERARRFIEFVTMLDELLRQPEASLHGDYYRVVEGRTYPGCVQRPRLPFAVAATGPRGMRLAAELGQTWVTVGDLARGHDLLPVAEGVRVVSAQMASLDEACAGVGRDPATLSRLVLTGPRLDPGLASPATFDDAVGRYGEIGVTDLVVHWPRPDGPYAGDRAVFEQIFSQRAGHTTH
ncbi:MAG TPA: LLM class flavin-dependent oxidoreductase [Acidimicrobiales bacterium]|nr:LLM class flavin-dependent oxidoreductase [Acidimicrobiales bacterium]